MRIVLVCSVKARTHTVLVKCTVLLELQEQCANVNNSALSSRETFVVQSILIRLLHTIVQFCLILHHIVFSIFVVFAVFTVFCRRCFVSLNRVILLALTLTVWLDHSHDLVARLVEHMLRYRAFPFTLLFACVIRIYIAFIFDFCGAIINCTIIAFLIPLPLIIIKGIVIVLVIVIVVSVLVFTIILACVVIFTFAWFFRDTFAFGFLA
mmetsp:Transcript_49350/g.82114  ORF Transcript_49350/g.82114 Transcript_49350/m.82114 type:complete len:209 (-) Transcript_49350:34-660(-)